MKENNNCYNCKKLIGINKNEESGDYKYISLGKDWDGRTNATQEGVCLSCFNKNQEKYKQDWNDIGVSEGSWNNYGVITNTTWPNEAIQARCRKKGCGKKFDCKTAEKDRHEWSQNEIDADEHEELNKNPTPVKTMEDLVKQWMGSMGYQKVFIEERTMKIKKSDGKVYERWIISKEGWNGKLEKWLKEQPNKEIEVKAERERERERERAKSENYENELLN